MKIDLNQEEVELLLQRVGIAYTSNNLVPDEYAELARSIAERLSLLLNVIDTERQIETTKKQLLREE